MQRLKLVLIGSSLLFGATAFAQGDPAPAGGDTTAAGGATAGGDATVGAGGAATTPAVGATGNGAAAATTPAPKLWVGGGLEIAPIGTISVSAGGQSADFGTDTGLFGVDVVALYAVHPMVSVGIAPRYLLNIKGGNGSGDSASMYDIRAVGAVHKEVAPKIQALGMLGLGYASISVPDQGGMSVPSPAGLTVSVNAGAGYAIGPKLMATALLGYELGFQSASQGGVSADEHFNHFSIGVGVMAAVM
jgi:hypothetical protein